MGIIFIKEKDLIKNAEKFVEYNEYLFVDGTDNTDTKLTRFNGIKSLPIFKVPFKASKDGQTIAGDSKGEKSFVKHIKSVDFKNAVLAITKVLIECDGKMNIFIALKSSDYDGFAKHYKKIIVKYLGDIEGDFIYLYGKLEKMDKKDLKKLLSTKTKSKVMKDVKDGFKEFRNEMKKGKKKSSLL